MDVFILFILCYINLSWVDTATLETIKCGKDHKGPAEGMVPNDQYPWFGALFYTTYGGLGETRAVTSVVLIHEEFVIGNSADIGPIPKVVFRESARVLLGEGWERYGRRVRNYLVHPEYRQTINSIAIVHLSMPVRDRPFLKPICPPPERIRYLKFWVVKFEEKLENLQKRVLPVEFVPAFMCSKFYQDHNLDDPKRRPSHVKCAISLEMRMPCVWDAGSALVTRDVWDRWQLLGLGVRGPGCGAPSRYLDMLHYYPWIEDSLNKFQRITISEIHQHKYVLRTGSRFGSLMQFGECEDYEKQNLIYRDALELRTDNNNVKRARYNMSIFDSVQYSCMVIELLYASASAELRVRHFCPRQSKGLACYSYKGTRFDVAVDVLFTESCRLDLRAWGLYVNMSLLNIKLWKWEEGTYYEDFKLEHVEYRGPTHMTTFGFEPLDESMWVPDYDRWSTQPADLETTTTRFVKQADDSRVQIKFDNYNSSATMPTTLRTTTRKKFKKKTPKPTYWQTLKWNNAKEVFSNLFSGDFWSNAFSWFG